MAEKLSAKVILHNRYGLHARPAALFVQTSNRFGCDIQVTNKTLTVSGKNILGVMTLGAAAGSEITITAEGDDAAAALESLIALVNDNFGESQSSLTAGRNFFRPAAWRCK